ncbi:MAG: restriction endonuclease subunit S [Bacteroidales bacterium]|nr:restriction endonuclease subunit S [Bacteroidales bacterium]
MPTYPTYKFTDLATLIRGVSYDKSVVSTSEREGYIPILRANNIQNSLVLNDLVYVPNDFVKEEQMICEGDIVLAMSSGSKDLVGKSAQADKDINAAFGTFCGLIRAKEIVDSKFLGLYFQTQEYRNFVSYQSQGVNICNLKKKDIESLQIPLPPLTTQRAIVTRIESLFAELDKAAEHLRSAQQQIKTYRQAALNHWLNNDDGKWEMVKLGEVLQKIEAGKSFRCNEKVPALHEKGIVKISAVTWGEFLEDECKTIINEDLYNPQFAIHKGDLLISRANTIQLVGNCVLVRKEPKRNIMLSDKVLRLVISDNADSDFILYSLRTSKSRTQIQNMSTGNQDSMRNIGQDRIKKIEIPLPPLTEQQRIVKEIESRLSQAEAAEASIAEALQKTEALRQSILKKAFSGELV